MKNKKVLLIGGAVALGIGAYWYYNKNKSQLPELVTDAKDSLTTAVKNILNPSVQNTGIVTPTVKQPAATVTPAVTPAVRPKTIFSVIRQKPLTTNTAVYGIF